MINELKLDGVVSKIFKDGTSAKGTRYVSFGFKHQPTGRSPMYFNCVAFGDLVDSLVSVANSPASNIRLHGRYEVKSNKDKDGKWINNHQIVVNNFNTVHTPVTMDNPGGNKLIEPLVKSSETFNKKYEQLKQEAFSEEDVPF